MPLLSRVINGLIGSGSPIPTQPVQGAVDYLCIQMMGQSNVMGRDSAINLPAPKQGKLTDILIYNYSTSKIEQYEAGVNSTLDSTGLNYYGYEVHIATQLRDMYNMPVIIFKFGEGGTTLAQSTNSKGDWNVNSTNELLDMWEGHRSAFLTKCAQTKINPIGMPLIWHQGETDAFQTTSTFADAYQVNETDLFNRVIANSILGSSNKIVSVNIESTYGDHASTVRSAKSTNASSFSEVVLLDADGKPLKDTVHLNTSGLLQMGNEIFEEIKNDFGV